MPIPQTIVVVAPRILLANQLCSEFLEHIDNVEVLHVHSGETISRLPLIQNRYKSGITIVKEYIDLYNISFTSQNQDKMLKRIQYIMTRHTIQYKRISLRVSRIGLTY